MNEYNLFEAAKKAKVGETLKSVSGLFCNIKKTEFGFYWQNDEKEPVELVTVFLSERWIILEEVARQQSEKKIKDFIGGLSDREKDTLSYFLQADLIEKSNPAKK